MSWVIQKARLALPAGLIVVLYADVVASMVARWWEDEGYSHAFLVVPLAAYMGWKQRGALASLPARPDRRGLLGVALACVCYVVGTLGAEFFLTRISLLLLLGGLVWTWWGVERLRRVAFPLLLVASAVPLPVLVYNRLAAPLQLLASAVSTEVAHSLGISVYRDGNIIYLANTSLGVAEACSGLRSVSSLTVAALLLAYLELRRTATRLALVLVAVPIAVLSNVVRVAGTAVLSEHDPSAGLGFYHGFSGWLIFLCGFGLLWAACRLLQRCLEAARGRSQS
jgi:exosortase